jgi:hypothetical protein
MGMVDAGVLEKNVGGSMRSPGMCEVGQQGHSTSMLLCAATTWLCLVVGKGAVSCCYENQGRVPSSKEDLCPDVVWQSSVVLLCVNGESGVSERVKGICLTDSK